MMAGRCTSSVLHMQLTVISEERFIITSTGCAISNVQSLSEMVRGPGIRSLPKTPNRLHSGYEAQGINNELIIIITKSIQRSRWAA